MTGCPRWGRSKSRAYKKALACAGKYRGSIHIDADPDVVFEYFTQPEALVRWMGERAVLDPTPGGEFTVWIGGRCVEGRYVEIDRPRRLVIRWGRRGSRAMPPFSSTLEVTFTPEAGGTRVRIVHDGLPDTERPRHAQGWQHYLARLEAIGSCREPETHGVSCSVTDGVD